MTGADINGIGGAALTSGHFNGADTISSRLDVGVARLAADGSRPRLIRELGLYLGGYGGATVCSVFVGGAGSPQFSVPSGNAGYVGSIRLNGSGALIRETAGGGASVAFGYGANRGSTFGRNAQAGISVAGGTGSFANAVLAGTYGYQDVPSAPQTIAASQVGVTAARVTWTPPADDGGGYEGITGYHVEASKDPSFVSGVISIDVGAGAREATFQNLDSGSLYYFLVLAANACTAAAGTYGSVQAANVPVQLIADTGNIDGWAGYGALPSGIHAVTAQGVRRATIATVAGRPSALLRETNVVTAPATLAIDTYGIERTITGLTVGKVYRLEAKGAYVGTAIDADTPNVYQLGRSGGPYGDPVELAELNVAYDFPSVEFTATATSQTVRFRLHEAATRAATGEMERLAVWGIKVSEIASASPFRLQSIAYESSLLNHFDLANNSVGARWWVDRDGITQFSAQLGTEGPIATFTDRRQPDKLEYTDIATSFDTRNVVNDLTGTNHGAVSDGAGGWNTDDTALEYVDLTSIATNGVRQDSVEMSLYDQGTYAGSVDARAGAILAEYNDPEFTVRSIRWNALEDPELASRLDIYSPIDIEFRGNTYPFRIVNIEHILTPTRWIAVLQLDTRG